MNNMLLFHIGRMKTGTTALQMFLYENSRILEQYGWCYPNLKKELPEIQEWNLADGIKNGVIFYTKEGKIDTASDNWNKAWEKVINHLENYNVVISSEEIAEQDTDLFLKGAIEKYNNIKVVIYLRRQDKAMESLWNQEIKAALSNSRTIHESITDETIESFHYLKKLKQISEIVGKENVIVRAYEKQQFCGEKHTIMSDFLSILGIDPDWCDWKESFFPNPRLEGNFFEIKKIFNSIGLAIDVNIQNGQYAYAFMNLSKTFCQKKKEMGYFTSEEREKFLEKFADDNTEIAKEYLHREDGKLFYDERLDYPLYDPHSCSSFEEDIIRVFSSIICLQNENLQWELQRLKKQNYFFVRKLLLQNRNERELLFFGAGYWCCELLNKIEFPIAFIVDNDIEKNGRTLMGKEIVHTEKITDWLKYFVVVTCAKTDEIEKQLHGYGLHKERDYVLAKEYLIYDR